MNNHILLGWIGDREIRSFEKSKKAGDKSDRGSVLRVLKDNNSFTHAYILSNQRHKDKIKEYERYLRSHIRKLAPTVNLTVLSKKMNDPWDFHEAYLESRDAVRKIEKDVGENVRITYLFSAGTPGMRVALLVLSRTLHPGKVIGVSPDEGIQETEFPLNILEYSPDTNLLIMDAPHEYAEAFGDITLNCPLIEEAVRRAGILAQDEGINILITGESGTGKELFSQAIHRSSPRGRKDNAMKKFRAVNCGAFPENLIEAELFGHEAGAFSDAKRMRKGIFEEADKGTVFLDEIGELPLNQQVKLLRVLQEREVVRIGGNKRIKVDVRIVAATNKDLAREVREGRFREDLFYRVMQGNLYLPPIRERSREHRKALAAELLDSLNRNRTDRSLDARVMSAEAMETLIAMDLPGNARQMDSIVRNSATWAAKPEISKVDIQKAARAFEPLSPSQEIADPPGCRLAPGMTLDQYLDRIQRKLIVQTLKTERSLSAAARTLGLNSYQTLKKRMDRLSIDNNGNTNL